MEFCSCLSPDRWSAYEIRSTKLLKRWCSHCGLDWKKPETTVDHAEAMRRYLSHPHMQVIRGEAR